MLKKIQYLIFIGIVMISCDNNILWKIINESDNYSLISYKLIYTKKTIEIATTNRKRLELGNSTIDTTFYKLSKDDIKNIFNHALISTIKDCDAPFLGDGLGYHIIIKFTYNGRVQQIYFYRNYTNKGYLRFDNKCYVIKLRKEAKQMIDKK